MSTLDPFADDPLVLSMEQGKREDAAANWRDQRHAYGLSGSMDAAGPCPECGADQLARDDLGWCCAECGNQLYFRPRIAWK